MRDESQASRNATVWGTAVSVGRERGGERNWRRTRPSCAGVLRRHARRSGWAQTHWCTHNAGESIPRLSCT